MENIVTRGWCQLVREGPMIRGHSYLIPFLGAGNRRTLIDYVNLGGLFPHTIVGAVLALCDKFPFSNL